MRRIWKSSLLLCIVLIFILFTCATDAAASPVTSNTTSATATSVTSIAAASPTNGKSAQIQISGWLDYSSAYGMLYYLNLDRQKQGLNSVEMDREMMEAAVQYAKELTVCMDANLRSDGSQNFIEREGLHRSVGSFMDFAPNIEVSQMARSVGIACFVADEVTYYCAIESTEEAYQVAEQPDDRGEIAQITLKGDYSFFIDGAEIIDGASNPDIAQHQNNSGNGNNGQHANSTPSRIWRELAKGQTLPATLCIANDPSRPDQGTSIDNICVEWQSKDPEIVTIKNGQATGQSFGKTELVATLGDYELNFPVTVGMCGDQATWFYDEDKLELTIQGQGNTFDYKKRTPWHNKKIETIHLSEGITSLGERLFYEADVVAVELPSTICKIGKETFGNHSAVALYFLGNAPQFAPDSFKYTQAQVYYLENDVSWADSVKQNYGGEITWHIWNSNTLPPKPVWEPVTNDDIVSLSVPTITACRNTSKGVKITWQGVPGAIGYDIFRKKAASWKKVKSVGPTVAKWTNTTVSEGHLYNYKVRAIAADGQTITAEPASIYHLLPVKSFTAERVSRKKIKVRWGVNKKSTGYELQYSFTKDFTKNVTKLSLKKYSLREKYVSNINKAKTYYVRIRSYKKVEGRKHYSSWTKVQKCK